MKRTLLLFALCSLCSCVVTSQTSSKSSSKLIPAKEQQPTQLSEQEMMAKMQEAMTPGAEHQILNPLVGKWDTQAKFWMKPGQPPSVDQGVAITSWTLDGRYIEEAYTGTFGPHAYTGKGVLGFDKIRGEYTSIWYDSMSTGMAVAYGRYDPSSRTLNMRSTMHCPMTGGPKEQIMRTTILSDDKHILELWDTDPRRKVMEIVYTRDQP